MTEHNEIEPKVEPNAANELPSKNLSLAGHLCGLICLTSQSWLSPLIVFFIIILNKDTSVATQKELKTAFNFHLSQFLIQCLLVLIAIPSAILIVPLFFLIPLLFVQCLFWAISSCIAAYKVSQNKPYRYLFSYQFMKPEV